MQTSSDPFRAFVTLVLAVLLMVLVGWLLVIGKAILLPIFTAVISVYILVSASDWLGRKPVIRVLPEWSRRVLVLAAFLCFVLFLAAVIVRSAQQVIDRAPGYQQNLVHITMRFLSLFGIEREPNWQALARQITEEVNLQKLAVFGLGSFGSLVSVIVMVAVYASFLMGERNGFARKISAAMPGESAAETQRMVREINRSIGDYLTVKTLVNVILAARSYGVLKIFQADFAVFWAILMADDVSGFDIEKHETIS